MRARMMHAYGRFCLLSGKVATKVPPAQRGIHATKRRDLPQARRYAALGAGLDVHCEDPFQAPHPGHGRLWGANYYLTKISWRIGRITARNGMVAMYDWLKEPLS